MAENLYRVRRALLSVSDKEGLQERAEVLASFGVELVSTGGTARCLEEAGLSVRDVSELTGFEEMLDGRVKTLHPAVHGGLLFRRDDSAHCEQVRAGGIESIDMVVVDLYPFERTLERGGTFEECVEQIDIGGAALMRSAAKNAVSVVVCSGMSDMDEVLEQMRERDGCTVFSLRKRMAARAFARISAYDSEISGWYGGQTGEVFGEWCSFGGRRERELRYGENPHQSAALYRGGAARPGVISARQVQGKPLSYNNISDIDAAFELVAELSAGGSAAVIVKHATPCGAAVAESMEAAYRGALSGDSVSAFGGVVALSGILDEGTALAVSEIFTEALIAPEAEEKALHILSGRKNLRVLLAGSLPDPGSPGRRASCVAGGFLLQDRDAVLQGPQDWRCVTEKRPCERELSDLLLCWRVVKHVRSNAVVYGRDGAVCGIGGGQGSRLGAADIGGSKVSLSGSCVAASDAFFPFADGLESVAGFGASAVVQPGGSVRDEEVIEAANRLGISMLFTGRRHFRH